MKRILITGSNRGVGLELARQTLARGDRVFAGCRSPERASALEELSAKYHEQITILSLDVADEESLAKCVAIVDGETEALDIIFNNAAIFRDGETIKTFQMDDVLHMLNVNAVGQILVVKYFFDLLKNGADPKVVNISSEAGSISRMTEFRGYYYYASKAALNMFTRALAWDPETEGITVVAIHPGWVRTDMGGSDADLSPSESAEGILKVTKWITDADKGKFFTWQGLEYPW
jgi:NAD(P)-dependent dehydrogenase (short-subunit alcohol dehydrogenase family)